MLTFYNNSKSFFNVVIEIVLLKTILFGIIFSAIYLWIFINFLAILNEEIWVVQGIVNMIPLSVIKKNQRVREQIWARNGTKF